MTAASPVRPIAVVTGASRGIGRATALHLAARGCRVFALARSAADLASLAAEARAGGSVETIPTDLADDLSLHAAVDAVTLATEGYGTDILVNNAGYGRLGPLEEVRAEELRRQLEVNVIAVHSLTRAMLPGMRTRSWGRVINVSSSAGRVSAPFMGAYSASKYAVEAMSDALRVELSPWDVKVILIEPGPIRTDFGRAALQEVPVGSAYTPFLQSFGRARAGNALFERSPEVVARLITHAALSPHPHARYVVTAPARLGALARRLAPDVLMDAVFRLTMRG